MNLLKYIFPHRYDRVTGIARSDKWPEVQKAHIKEQPKCQVCGTEKNRNVHHIQDFSTYPELELVDSNLITLCRPHHLLVGHLMNWSSINPDVVIDSETWRNKIANRRK